MTAGFGSESSSEGEEEDAGDSEGGSNDLPIVRGFALEVELVFNGAELLLVLFEVLVVAVVSEPSSLSLGTGGEHDQGEEQADEDEMFEFHDGVFLSLKMKRASPS
jgi:hypothetical protein